LPVDLQTLLLNLDGLTDVEVENQGRSLYLSLYARGPGQSNIVAFDGSEVLFFDDRFEHAFFTTTDKVARKEAKNRIARERVARIHWIGPVIRGEVANTQCWETAPRHGTDPRRNRVCIVSSDLYVVWLEPLRGGRWKFSTAYRVAAEQASQYARGKRKVWGTKNAP
jgi:hypothetical protein